MTIWSSRTIVDSTHIGTNFSTQPRPVVFASHHVVGSVDTKVVGVMNSGDDPLSLYRILHNQSLSFSLS